MPSGLELARLRGLGQQPPLTDPGGAPLDYEEPDAYLDPAEQQMLMPRGLPGPNRSGGLGQLGLMSRLADVVHGPSGPSATPPPGAEEAKLREAPKASAAADVSGAPARGRTWMTGAPDAAAEAERAQRQAGAYGSLAESGAKLAKLVLTAAMGGGAGAGGVGGAGEAAGTAPGASSGAGFGTNYMSGLKSGTGTGMGGFLGRLSSGVATGSTQGTESGALSRLSESGSPNGGRFDDALSALTGSAARRRAALEAAGQGPYGAGLVSDAGGVPWAGGS